MVDDWVNHYSGELPSYEPNQEKASEVAFDGVASESPQQQAPNSQMVSSTCTKIIIHPQQLPYHLNAIHSNISFGIALRNLAKKIKLVPEQHVLKQVIAEQIESQTCIEQINDPDCMIISDSSDGKDEQTDSWFKPGFLKFACSSSTMISESVPDQPDETNTFFVEPILAAETLPNDLPSSSNQTIQPGALVRSTNVPFPPTLFLDSTLLADVCENIFQELNKLIEARNNLLHEDVYEKQWRRLRERVEFIMSELQRSCLDAQDIAQKNLQDWLQGVVNNLQEVRVSRTLVRLNWS